MSQPDPVVPNNAPLAPEQAASLNSLLNGLQADQLLWMEGFISGLRAGSGAPAAGATAAVPAPELTVLYGTESGNSEALRRRIRLRLSAICTRQVPPGRTNANASACPAGLRLRTPASCQRSPSGMDHGAVATLRSTVA